MAVSGGSRDEREVGVLQAQDWFGERALITREPRAMNVIASSEQTHVLSISSEQFHDAVGSRFHELVPPGDLPYMQQHAGTSEDAARTASAPAPAPEDLRSVSELGRGLFGRVFMCQDVATSTCYALKSMRKQAIFDSKLLRAVLNEKTLLTRTQDCPFTLNIVSTFQDQDHVFILTELIQGGDLFSLLYSPTGWRELKSCRHARGGFATPTMQFMIACVTSALEHLHERGIAFRDLKPENVMVDATGYLKIIDFVSAAATIHRDTRLYHTRAVARDSRRRFRGRTRMATCIRCRSQFAERPTTSPRSTFDPKVTTKPSTFGPSAACYTS